mmetsp:Transcript_49282/g.159101  ORF Transcript_49282/g.159101 Transcript_49282/m.159101 type:complete len:393 (+) Transcript_49282:746-1924(+)
MLLGQSGPIVVGLCHDLEAVADGRLDVRELLKTLSEDEATADGIRHAGRTQDDQEVENVQHTSLQGVDDDTESGLGAEGHEETHHEQQVVLCNGDGEVARKGGILSGGVDEAVAQKVALGRRVCVPGGDDVVQLFLEGAQLIIRVQVPKQDYPTHSGGRALQQEPARAHVLPQFPLLPLAEHRPDFERRDDDKHHCEDSVGGVTRESRPIVQEDGVQPQLPEDITRARKRQRQHVGLQARAAHLHIEEGGIDGDVLGLLVQPLALVEVVQALLKQAVLHVSEEHSPVVGAAVADTGRHLTSGKTVLVGRNHGPQASRIWALRAGGRDSEWPVVVFNALLHRDVVTLVLASFRRGDLEPRHSPAEGLVVRGHHVVAIHVVGDPRLVVIAHGLF